MDKVVLDDRKECQFCGKLLIPKKYTVHRCVRRLTAIKFWQFWKEHSDQSDRTRFPTFDAWHTGIMEKRLVIQDYPYGPRDDSQVVAPSATPDGRGDIENYDEEVHDGAPAGNSVEQENSSAELALPPVTVDEDATRPGVKEIAQRVTAGALEVKLALREGVGLKERAWYPIVIMEQVLLNWAYKAQQYGYEKKLTRDEKKLMALGHQTTLGDSPILKLRKKGLGGDLDTPDLLTASMEVWGEWCITNYSGLFERGGETMAKIKKWRVKNEQPTKA